VAPLPSFFLSICVVFALKDFCGGLSMLGLLGEEVHRTASGWQPVYVEDNVAVMSVGFMLESEDAVSLHTITYQSLSTDCLPRPWPSTP
jgi:hypothetical protein